MIQQTFSTTTTATTREQIWSLMADVDNWNTWDNGVEQATLKGNFETGSGFILKPKGGPKVNIRLVDVQPATYFKDQTNFPLAKMYGEHWYEETAEGLKITVTMTIKGPLAALWNKIVMKGIIANLAHDVQAQINASQKR